MMSAGYCASFLDGESQSIPQHKLLCRILSHSAAALRAAELDIVTAMAVASQSQAPVLA